MSTPNTRHVVVFAKQPRMGRVKTRLAADIGAVRAAAFYRVSLAATLRTVAADPRWTAWLACAPDTATADPALARLRGGLNLHSVPQGGGDLGARMDRMMRRLPPGPAVIVGSDIAGLTAAAVWRAFRALGDRDAVFGPSPDGGYWLVGFKRAPIVPRPFAGVRWSGPHALADTRANLGGGLRTALIDTLDDIDTGADLGRLSKTPTAGSRLCRTP
jgi:rSAM/selenodomain-associated transferase 1